MVPRNRRAAAYGTGFVRGRPLATASTAAGCSMLTPRVTSANCHATPIRKPFARCCQADRPPLPLVQLPAGDDRFAAGGQGAELVGDDDAFRDGGLLKFAGQDRDFLPSGATAAEFPLAFAATHKLVPLLGLGLGKTRHYAITPVRGQPAIAKYLSGGPRQGFSQRRILYSISKRGVNYKGGPWFEASQGRHKGKGDAMLPDEVQSVMDKCVRDLGSTGGSEVRSTEG